MRAYPSAEPLFRNPIMGIAGCCAREARGHAAAPPRRVRNERRCMRSIRDLIPRGKVHAPVEYDDNITVQSRGLQPASPKWCARRPLVPGFVAGACGGLWPITTPTNALTLSP